MARQPLGEEAKREMSYLAAGEGGCAKRKS